MSGVRVGYVLKRFPRLSQTFVLHELLELERRGVDVVVLAGRDGGEELTHPAVARLRAPVTYVGADAGPAADAVAAAVAEHGLTHLHAHFAGWAARVADAAGTAAGVPFSLTAHATDIYRADVDTTALAGLLSRAAAVVTVTDGNVGVLAAMAPGARVVRVYNGVDVTGIAPGPRAADRTRTALAVGRFVPKKGFDDLVRALAVLRAQGADVAVTFVGDGPERGPLTTLASDLGVADLVSMPGSADGEAVAAAMRSAAVLAVPCVVTADGDRDALPTVVIEAMAHGLPVLATDVNGLPEMVEDAVSGVVVPQRSPEVLAAALARLLDDPAGRDALATAARSRAEALFDLRRNVGALADLYAGAGAAR